MLKHLVKNKLEGRTQRWLCTQIGMGDVDLSNSVNGYRRFKWKEFERLREVLGITDEDLKDFDLDEIIKNNSTNS